MKSQATRSRTQNESIARRILAEKVEVLEKGKESRVEKKRELMSKRKRSAMKKKRRKYRGLQQDGGEYGESGEDEGEGELDEVDVIAQGRTEDVDEMVQKDVKK